jgi:hypothetical protein
VERALVVLAPVQPVPAQRPAPVRLLALPQQRGWLAPLLGLVLPRPLRLAWLPSPLRRLP